MAPLRRLPLRGEGGEGEGSRGRKQGKDEAPPPPFRAPSHAGASLPAGGCGGFPSARWRPGDGPGPRRGASAPGPRHGRRGTGPGLGAPWRAAPRPGAEGAAGGPRQRRRVPAPRSPRRHRRASRPRGVGGAGTGPGPARGPRRGRRQPAAALFRPEEPVAAVPRKRPTAILSTCHFPTQMDAGSSAARPWCAAQLRGGALTRGLTSGLVSGTGPGSEALP